MEFSSQFTVMSYQFSRVRLLISEVQMCCNLIEKTLNLCHYKVNKACVNPIVLFIANASQTKMNVHISQILKNDFLPENCIKFYCMISMVKFSK